MRDTAVGINYECLLMTDAGRITYIVDDDDGFRQSLQVLLDSHGFRTFPFRSGKEFLSVIDALDHGCVILDIDMPEMTGIDVFDELRARGTEMPVFFVTGSPHGSLQMALNRQTDVRLFEKTADMSVIIAHIDEALGKCRPAG
jgi:FixJ family two-component response regulator